jgi:ribonuclease BN (tRNA processing enzyme)
MKIHFLGTNGWYNTPTGETTCIFIDAREAYIILDAGNGFRKLDTFITNPGKPVYLFLSHFHLDHTYGLHVMPKMKWPQGMTIIGQKGSKKNLGRLINKPWSCPLDKLATPITIHEVKPGRHDKPIPFECAFLVHADPCMGFRLAIEGRIITFMTDTGICDAMIPLARGADLLITECAWRVPNQYAGWPHLTPEDGATIARRAGVTQLALIHFDAHGYPTMAEREDAEVRARAIFPHSRITHDDTTISL